MSQHLSTAPDKIVRILCFYFYALLFTFVSAPTSAQANNKVESLVPVLQLLLLDERGPVPARIGTSSNRVISSDSFDGAIALALPRVYENVTFSIDIAQIDANDDTFVLPASGLARNEIVIKYRDGSEVTFSVTRISAFLESGPTTLVEAQRFLMRATFGPNRNDLQRVLEIGYSAWIDEQFAIPQTFTLPLYDKGVLDRAMALSRDTVNDGNPDPMYTSLGASQLFVSRMDSWWQAAYFGRDQLRQRVTWALSQIFTVTETNPRVIPFFHDTLAENAFANYYDLLSNVSLTPTMGTYLGMLGNSRATTGNFPTRVDENFAREVMQLFSIGLVELELNGEPRLVNGEEVETYNQDTVRNFARVFTGWHTGTNALFRPGWERTPMNIRDPNNEPRWHDTDAKTLLNGHVNPAGLSTREDFERAMRNIADHDNVGPFFSKLLIKRLVKSNPSPEYVARVATVFNDNGTGVRGDMAAVIKAILLDNEALNGHTDFYGGKIKEPVIAISQLWRAFGARSRLPLGYVRLNSPYTQRPYSAPTVFGFFEPDFAPQGRIDNEGLTAPEFKLFTDFSVRSSLDQLFAMANSAETGINAGREYQSARNVPMAIDYSELLSLSNDSDALIARLDERLMGGLMSEPLKQAIKEHIDNLNEQQLNDPLPLGRIKEALSILVVSPEYMVQR